MQGMSEFMEHSLYFIIGKERWLVTCRFCKVKYKGNMWANVNSVFFMLLNEFCHPCPILLSLAREKVHIKNSKKFVILIIYLKGFNILIIYLYLVVSFESQTI